MGAILNRFDKLIELKNDSNKMSQFKLTAVIVHDPNDKELCNHIRTHFHLFAEVTGKNFLFITFIQPPKEYEYIERLRNNEFSYARYLVSDREQGSDIEHIVSPQLRRLYQINEKGSFLILAEKLLDRKFYKIRITTTSLPYQFMRLRDYCDNPGNLDNLIHTLEGEPCLAKEILVDSLIKFVSLVSPAPKNGEYSLYYWKQREMAIATIKEEKENLLYAIEHLPEDQSEKILNLYDFFAHTYKNVLKQNGLSPSFIKYESYKNLEKQSKRFLNTCARLLGNLSENERDVLDYSAFTLFFGKVVENELNLSIGQMLRYAMGIDMPKYYNRYCRDKGSVFIPTPKMPVYINSFELQGDYKKVLKGIPLGNLLYAYKSAVDKEYVDGWEVDYPEHLVILSEKFLSFWEDFAHIRNKAAHLSEVNENSFKNAEEKFKTFMEEYLETFTDIRKMLSPRADV